MKKHTFKMTKTIRARLAAALAAILLVNLLPLVPGLSELSPAAPAPAQVINNYPTNITPGQLTASTAIALDQMDWTKKAFHSFYDNAKGLSPVVKSSAQAYTATTSKQYNGTATPDHVVLSKDSLRFLGYGAYNNLDLLYTDAYSSFETLDFTFKPKQIKFHTLNQSGLLFNGSFSGANNAYYTGYALLMDVTTQSQGKTKGAASLKLVYMDNQLFNTSGNDTFPAAGLTFTTQDAVMPNIVEGTTPDFQVQLAKTATGFSLYIDGNLVREIDPSAGASLPGFGFFAGYYAHSCKAMTVVEYSNLKIAVNMAPTQTTPMVKFIDKDTGAEVADAQTKPINASVSYAGDEFWVDVSGVQTITGTDGTLYRYVASLPNKLTHITYQAGGSAKNLVTLYYKNQDLIPEKHASIDGGANWNDGTAADPVIVNQGDTIDYKVEMKVPSSNASAAKPVRFTGAVADNSGSTDIRPLSAIDASQKFYSYLTAPYTGTYAAAYPYDDSSYPTLSNYGANIVNGSAFNPVNTSCGESGGDNLHTNCNSAGHQYPTNTAQAGLTTINNLNATYYPQNLKAFPPNASDSPYITSWYTNRFNSNRGFPTGSKRAFENYLWLKAPNLPAGDYKVSVKASLDFRSFDVDDTRYNSASGQKHSAQTFTFRGVAMSSSEYQSFMQNPSPSTTATGAFGYMGAGRNNTQFPDSFLQYADSAGAYSVSWNTNNLSVSGGTTQHTATSVNAYNGSSRSSVYQMMADGSSGAYAYRGNKNASAETVRQQLSNTVTISSDGQGGVTNGMVGLNFTADMTLSTYSSDTDWSDRIASAIRVYEVEFTPIQKAYEVTDLLPAGLQYVPGSMTTDLGPDYESAMTFTAGSQIPDGEDTARDLLTWDFAGLPAGTSSVRFKAKVTTDSGILENIASVTNKSSPVLIPDTTDPTWHAVNVAQVTERYQNYFSSGTALQDDTYSWVPQGAGYGVAPALRNPIDVQGKTYRYYGYSPDGGTTVITDTLPPDGQPLSDATDDTGAPLAADYLWDHVTGTASEVILYFVPDVQLTITSVDYTDPGNVLKTSLDYDVPGATPYLLSPVRLNSLGEYNFINRYKLDSSAESTGVPAAPVYTAAQMTADRAITLYFATDPQITLKFVENANETRILKNPASDTLLFGTDYDPAKSLSQPLPSEITDPLTGAIYEFSGYRLDDGTNVMITDIKTLPVIPTVEANHIYTLLYTRIAVPPQKDAYINDASGAQNGQENYPMDVKQGDKITYKITLGSSWAGPSRVADPSFQPVDGTTKPAPLNFVNGSFETPATSSNIQTSSANVPGWKNTAEDLIEIQHVGAMPAFAPIAPDGVQYAELNASTAGTLYQTVPTIPGTKVYWEFYHGARGVNPAPAVNTDVMDFLLGSSTSTLVPQVRATDSWVQGSFYVWGHYYGVYTVPAGQTSTVFAFQSISASGGTTQGNYLDGIRLYTSSFVELTKSNDAPSGKAGPGDTVTYTVKVQNNGESDAKNTQFFDTLPAGTELVPGSVALDGASTPNYSYNTSTRALNVNIGAGATASAGGLVKGSGSFSSDCNNAYTLTFKVKVTSDVVATNGLYENQSRVTFSDRPDDSATPTLFTNYSNVSSFGFRPPENTITDVVPAGLDVDINSISDGGAYDTNTRTITWHVSGSAPSDTVVSFDTTVSAEASYNNTATITLGDGTVKQTDTTYHRYVIKQYTLHLRQLVLDYNGSVALPETGYFDLENEGASAKRYGVTTFSNRYGVEVPFRSFDTSVAAGMVYTINDILPQYYDYAGYTVTGYYSPGAHTSTPASTEAPQINFAAGNELWVTVYIRPGSDPGVYSWAEKTNDFGIIYPTP